MTLRHVLSLALVGLVVVASAAACIDDPPPATTCPPVEPPATSCGAQFAAFATPGCGQTVYACLRPSCECPATECAPDPSACWPHGECPPAVTAQAAPGTSCLRVDTTDPNVVCPCGCTRCVAECDGKAFPLVFIPPPTPPNQPPQAALRFALGQLPASGRLGFYARLRGQVENGALVFAVTNAAGPVTIAPAQNLGPAYSETVLDTAQRPIWPNAAAAPTAIEVLVPGGAKVAVEIDCIIPFVEPL